MRLYWSQRTISSSSIGKPGLESQSTTTTTTTIAIRNIKTLMPALLDNSSYNNETDVIWSTFCNVQKPFVGGVRYFSVGRCMLWWSQIVTRTRTDCKVNDPRHQLMIRGRFIRQSGQDTWLDGEKNESRQQSCMAVWYLSVFIQDNLASTLLFVPYANGSGSRHFQWN